MYDKSFITTPIHTDTDENYTDSEFNQDATWMKRARKLRERRWRKLANKVPRSDDYTHFKPRHQAY